VNIDFDDLSPKISGSNIVLAGQWIWPSYEIFFSNGTVLLKLTNSNFNDFANFWTQDSLAGFHQQTISTHLRYFCTIPSPQLTNNNFDSDPQVSGDKLFGYTGIINSSAAVNLLLQREKLQINKNKVLTFYHPQISGPKIVWSGYTVDSTLVKKSSTLQRH